MQNTPNPPDSGLSLLCEMVESFHAIQDLDQMLEAIFQKIKSAFHIEGVSIALHNPAKQEFYFFRTVENGATTISQGNHLPTFPDDKGIAGWVMRNEAVLVNDVSTDPRVYNDLATGDDFVTRSMICVPLRTRKRFLGVLYTLNKISGKFSEQDKNLLEVLSGIIAVSLENARLYGELKGHLRTLEEEKRHLLSQARAQSGFDEIIGSSPAMRRLFDLIEKVLDTTTTVLIQGETGTGKELIARIIHYNGPLKDKPFVVENCGALPEPLLESELFGHVRGAFTGAVNDKKGLFEIADGGTIFLDEIGELPLTMQVKLLRIIQEGEFRPVGGSRTQRVNVRLIASTNRNLEEEVAKGNFRQDLFYRINVFQISPPPLRERKDDIVLLASHFLEKYARKNNRPVPHITPKSMDLLCNFDWPGNVRELENEMERALTMAAGKPRISADLLSDKIRRAQPEYLLHLPENKSGSLKHAVINMERQMIEQALKNARGNRTQAAKALGLSRQGLLNKIAAYEVAANQVIPNR
jgi:Nif-specific regulatory protein